VAAVVTILSGCAQPGPAAPIGASTSESAADSARTHGSSSGPTKDGGQSRTSSPTSSAKVSERSAGKSSAAKPTLEPRPEADLSDKQIPKIYSDDIAPGRQVTATLCNLTRGHLEVLEKHIAGHNG